MSQAKRPRVRTAHLTIRLSPDERAEIDVSAGLAELTPGSYARELILNAPPPRPVRRPPLERQELVRLLGELGRIGSNINQLAKDKNSGLLIYDGEIAAAVAVLLEMRVALLKALGRLP
jgi:hypothetical protein